VLHFKPPELLYCIDYTYVPHLWYISADGILKEDVLFKSPSNAAAFLIGGHANGLTEWKLKNGKTTHKGVENSETEDN